MRDVCLDCFKPPAFRSRAYCDCDPVRAFGTFDMSKEPISKTSRFRMFKYKRGYNWLGAIKGMAVWSRGFLRGSLFKTWPKPETAHEKPLAPRIHRRHFAGKPVVASVNVDCFLRLSFCQNAIWSWWGVHLTSSMRRISNFRTWHIHCPRCVHFRST